MNKGDFDRIIGEREDAVNAFLRTRNPDFVQTMPAARTCCERNQVNCNQGRDCPEAASASTEIGSDDLPSWIHPRLTLAILAINAVMLLWLLAVVLYH